MLIIYVETLFDDLVGKTPPVATVAEFQLYPAINKLEKILFIRIRYRDQLIRDFYPPPFNRFYLMQGYHI